MEQSSDHQDAVMAKQCQVDVPKPLEKAKIQFSITVLYSQLGMAFVHVYLCTVSDPKFDIFIHVKVLT